MTYSVYSGMLNTTICNNGLIFDINGKAAVDNFA